MERINPQRINMERINLERINLLIGQRVHSPIYGYGTVLDESTIIDAVYIQFDRIASLKTFTRYGTEIHGPIRNESVHGLGAHQQIAVMGCDREQFTPGTVWITDTNDLTQLQMIAAKDVSTHELTILTYRAGMFAYTETMHWEEFEQRRPELFDSHWSTSTMQRFSELVEARRLARNIPNLKVRGATGCDFSGSTICIAQANDEHGHD